MAEDTQNMNDENQYSDQNIDTDTTGSKGGTSQQSYNESGSEGMQDERGYDTDDDMNESTSGW